MPIELQTPDELVYKFYPVAGGVFNFKIRAPNDAHLALTSGPSESDPMLEVFLGGWGNTKSVIRRNRTKPDVVEVETPNILNAGEFRGFWVRWFNGIITVGREGEAAAFMSYEEQTAFPINYVGVCTGWGASGSWMIEDSPAAPTLPTPQGWTAPPPTGSGPGCWVPASGGQVPPEAVPGGMDGEQLYIARARHESALIPGKLVPSHGVAYISWGGAEHPCTEYEVLCAGGGQWVPTSGGNIPPQAMPAGESEDGEPLFVGRVNHAGTITPGKVHPSHGFCYIPYGGQEMAFADYEILVSN